MVINLLLGVFTDVKNDRLHCLLWYLQKMQHCFVNARRRVVHLATRVKIRPVVLSGSLPPFFIRINSFLQPALAAMMNSNVY